MSDFLDDKAAEGKDEEPQEDDEFAGLPEDEGEASDSGSSDGSGSSSDEDGDDSDLEDEFIVQEGEEDEDEGGEKEGEGEDGDKKKKKKRRRELVLEEDDYELLEENTGIRRARPQQHRRLKKARDVGRSEDDHLNAEQLKEELFGPDGEDLEDDFGDDEDKPGKGDGDGAKGGATGKAKARAGPEGEDEEDFFDDDEDDWIVNEFEEEEGGEGRGAAAAAARRRRRRTAQDLLPGVDAAALDEANEIFGDVDDMLAMYEERKAQRGGDGAAPEDEDEYAGLEPDDLDDDDAAEELRMQREERKKEAAARRVREHLEPGAVERHFLLPKDELIREKDVPEREQLRRGGDPEHFDVEACAEWVWAQLIGPGSADTKAKFVVEDGMREVEGPPPEWMHSSVWPADAMFGRLTDTRSHRGWYYGRATDQDRNDWHDNEEAQAALRANISKALHLLYASHEEVPLIGMYRKEQLGELLNCRKGDRPAVEDRDDEDGENLDAYGDGARGALKASDRRARRWDILYAVQHLAQQWRALQKRKEARQAAYRRALDSVPGDEERAAIQACITAARNAQSMEALEDVEARFAMVLPAPEESLADLDLDGFSQDPAGGSQIPSQEGPQGAARRRMPRRVTAHQIAIRAGLREAATALGMTGRQFGENIQASYKRNEPVDPSLTPEDYALEFINPERAARATPEAVLRSIVSIAAAELAAEPAARQFVRDFFWKRAEVTTELLPAGESALNPFHPLGVAKRLKHKPVKKFYDTDLFLKLAAAEGEGFVKLTIDLPVQKGPDNQPMVPDLQAVVSDLNDFYLSTGLSDEAEAWNKLRTAALREAITSHILPAIRREVRARLMAEGRVFLLQELTDALWEHASQAPIMLRAMEDNEEGEELSEKRIMSVVYSPGGGAATTLVMLDPAGQMVDYLHCPQLTGVIPKPRLIQGQTYSIFQDPRKATDAEAIRTFIEAHLPHAILVGVSHPDALNLLADVEMVCADILSINPRLLQTLETQDLRVEAADETLAALWGNSAAAREELPSSAPIVRKGVALARQALEPLAVLSSLCGPSKEVLSLRLHPLQGHLPEDERMRVIDEVLCAAVAQVGVDVNAAVAAPWRAAPLAFVPGLGPRKAAALLRTVARAGGHVESRRQIWKELGVMGNCVFRNAAPFLRVRASSAATANIELDVLDDTRVHPESYNHAVAIAQSVSQTDDATVALENAMAQPEEVEKLELELYDRHLQEEAAAAAAAEPDGEDGDGEGKGRRAVGTKLATLIDIQFEFVAPYGEMRPPRSRLDVDGRFWLALGEDRSTLKPGRKVEAQVKYVNSAFVKCVVPELNGFEAEIPATAVSSKPGQETVDCRDYFKKGDTVVAVVMEVLPKESKVLLATSSRMLNNDLTWEKEYMTKLDSAYVVPDERELQAEAAKRRPARPQFVRRNIRHPSFKNFSIHEATTQLTEANTPIGAAMVRPHAKSLRTLVISMRLPAGQMWHVDVKELGQRSSNLTLAPPLEVNPIPSQKHVYDDLDELVARYIEPLGSAMRALAKHPKWRGGGDEAPMSWAQVQENLRAQRAASTGYVPYCLAAETEPGRIGAFYLAYLMGSTPRREFFVVLPEGFYFRKKVYPTIDDMLVAFKRDPTNKAGRPQQPEAQYAAAAAPQAVAQYGAQPYTQQPQYGGQQQAGWYGGGSQWGPTTAQDPYGQQQYPQQYAPQYGGGATGWGR